MHWLVLGAGGAIVALAAVLRLAGGAGDFQAHALPFWLFILGIVGLFAGGWIRDNAKVAASPAFRHAATSVGPTALAVAPQMAPPLTGGLSSNSLSALQRPAATAPAMNVQPMNVQAMAAAATAAAGPALAASVGASDIMARIHALETENNILRAFLLEAKSSIAR
jgi:hypothetical protein